MNNKRRLCGALLCAASLSACATVTRGTRQDYVIETDPQGAQIALSTGQTCTSPCTLRLKRKHEFTVTATMDGYEPAEARVDSVIRAGGVAGAAGNVLAGGVIGIIVDGSNGSMNDLTPNPLRIAMIRPAALLRWSPRRLLPRLNHRQRRRPQPILLLRWARRKASKAGATITGSKRSGRAVPAALFLPDARVREKFRNRVKNISPREKPGSAPRFSARHSPAGRGESGHGQRPFCPAP